MLVKRLIQITLILAVVVSFFTVTRPASAAGVCGSSYVVQPGDWLIKIAQRCGVSLSALYAANPWVGYYIYPGQVLVIPDASASVPYSGYYGSSYSGYGSTAPYGSGAGAYGGSGTAPYGSGPGAYGGSGTAPYGSGPGGPGGTGTYPSGGSGYPYYNDSGYSYYGSYGPGYAYPGYGTGYGYPGGSGYGYPGTPAPY
jgi:LysM repeat protein